MKTVNEMVRLAKEQWEKDKIKRQNKCTHNEMCSNDKFCHMCGKVGSKRKLQKEEK